MRRQRNAVLIPLIGVAAAVFTAPVASAGESADATVDRLRSQGHHVQLNGTANGSLSQCIATGVHGLRGSHIDDHGFLVDENAFNTVYVDIACNDTV